MHTQSSDVPFPQSSDSNEIIQEIYKELISPPPAVFTDIRERAVRTPQHKDKTAANADLVLLGDQWLEPAINQGALRPFYNANRYRYSTSTVLVRSGLSTAHHWCHRIR